MRSAVPQGGVGSGSIELRADGTLAEWTIVNQHPAGGAKIPLFSDALFGVKVVPSDASADTPRPSYAATLRTSPPERLPGVPALRYSGAYPISRLSVQDAAAPVTLSLFAASEYAVGELDRSLRPAITYTLAVQNPQPHPVNVSFLFNLPLALEQDTARVPAPNASDAPSAAAVAVTAAASAADCMRQCAHAAAATTATATTTAPPCAAWSFVAATGSCRLSFTASVPYNTFQQGVVSGVPGRWALDPQTGCLTLSRPGGGPTHGNVSLCGSAASSSTSSPTASSAAASARLRLFTADSVQQIWRQFTAADAASDADTDAVSSLDAYGAAEVSLAVPAGGNATLSIALGYYFPHRNYLSRIEGNRYATLWASSTHAATEALAELPDMYARISALHRVFFVDPADAHAHAGAASSSGGRQGGRVGESSRGDDATAPERFTLPLWLQDSLVNTLSHIRSAWFTAGGMWRQWEAYDCVDMDSVHNDGERHVPYLMFFPDTTRLKMGDWAATQRSDGMIQEQFGSACADAVPPSDAAPAGRVMSDVSSMFIMYTLELYQWLPADDAANALLRQLWPRVRRAAEWQLQVSRRYGVPEHLQSTYDILDFPAYPVAAYNSVMHLMALQAASRLAAAVGDGEFRDTCDVAHEKAAAALDELLWVQQSKNGDIDSDGNGDGATSTARGYWATVGPDVAGNRTLMADCLYGQVLSFTAGLGVVVSSAERIKQHLSAEAAANGSPWGLIIISGALSLTDGDKLWHMAGGDHAALSLWTLPPSHTGRRGSGAAARAQRQQQINAALQPLQQMVHNYRTLLKDQWNVAGLHSPGETPSDAALPFITSHYGYHMTQWHVIFALTGQTANLRDGGSLTFAPRAPCDFTLPVLLPRTTGLLSSFNSCTNFTLRLTIGSLNVSHLAVHNVPYPGGSVVLQAGQQVAW